MMLMCSKGCGTAIEVSESMLEEAKSANQPIDVNHEVCPNEDTVPLRNFKITINVDEVVKDDDGNDTSADKMASVGATVQAHTFKDALPKLSIELNSQWNRVLGMADIVDSE